MNSKLRLYLLLLLSPILQVSAQRVKTPIRQGNKAYEQGKYAEATKAYTKALALDSLSQKARYGLAGSLYQQGKYDEALPLYERVLQDSLLFPESQADIWHNIGNIHFKKKAYEESIKAYEESLIRRPDDDKTRYNLVLAQKLLQKQKNQNQQNQNKDQQDQNKNSPQQNKKQQNQQQKGGNNNQQQPPSQGEVPPPQGKQSPSQMSKETAEQILNAFKGEDDKTRHKAEEQMRAQEIDKQQNRKKQW